MSSLTTVPLDADRASAVLDVSSLWAPSFPSPDLVSAAVGLFTPLRRWDGREGARARLVIGPGVVQVSRRDPVKFDAAADRAREAAWKSAELRSTDHALERRLDEADGALEVVSTLAAGGLVPWSEVDAAGAWSDHLASRIERRDREDETPAAKITAWSAKSRARMVKTLLGLDYTPMFTTGEAPAMLTLTYPGEWEVVAPTAKHAARHVLSFRKRFERAWKRPLVAIWKREFQRRGAPHYHLLMVPPTGQVNGEGFREWASRVWAEVVGSASCGEPSPSWAMGQDGRAHIVCCERHRHIAGGTGVDYREGVRNQDPRRLAVYFSKHGSFASKDYQNEAPAAWVEAGSVGRFWGYWHLDVGTQVVEVTEVESIAAARTMRRWQRANGFRAQREVWRTNTRTGVMRKRKSGVWVGSRMRGRLGFVAVNDGPAFASRLAAYLDQVREAAQDAEIAAWLVSTARLRGLDDWHDVA